MDSNHLQKTEPEKPQEDHKLIPNPPLDTEPVLQRDENMRHKVYPIENPQVIKGEISLANGDVQSPKEKFPLSPLNEKTEKVPLIQKRLEEKAKTNIETAVKRIIKEENPRSLAEYQKSLLPEGVMSVESMLSIYELERIKKKSGIIKEFKQVHKRGVQAVVMTPDGRHIITGSEDRSIKIVEFETGAIVHHFENAHQRSISAISVSKDGKFLLSSSDNGTVKMFDLVTKKEVQHFQDADECYIYTSTLSNDGRFAFAGYNTLKMYDLQAKKLAHEFTDKDLGISLKK